MHAVIVANGPIGLPESFLHYADNADHIIAADGGANLCAKAGYIPHTLIGDLDSIDPQLLEQYRQQGVTIHRHPARKNATDLELALDMALAASATDVDLFGATGGRWDMSLSNISLACHEKYRAIAIAIHDHSTHMQILHQGSHVVAAAIGSTVSLLPIRGDVHGVSLEGFEYPLDKEDLHFGTSRGLSNVMEEERATIRFTSGVLAVIRSIDP